MRLYCYPAPARLGMQGRLLPARHRPIMQKTKHVLAWSGPLEIGKSRRATHAPRLPMVAPPPQARACMLEARHCDKMIWANQKAHVPVHVGDKGGSKRCALRFSRHP